MIFLSPRFLFLGEFYSARDMAVSSVHSYKIPEITFVHRMLLGFALFLIEVLFSSIILKYLHDIIIKLEYRKTYNKLFNSFMENMRFCYTRQDLVKVIADILENKADASVMLFDNFGQMLYNSPASFASNPETFDLLKSITKELPVGVHFFDSDFNSTHQAHARMVDFVLDEIHLFVVWPAIKDVDQEFFPLLQAEFSSFLTRSGILSKLIYLSELSQEWKQVSQTQLSFLPKNIPNIEGLDIGAYFKPLVNVSGDYYNFIQVSETKTLFVLGDVSGKGLAAALVMGVIVNIIKIAKDKEDLKSLIRLIDTAIKRMNLLDKYTVLFLGLIDTEAMTLKYVNASIENPMILTKAHDGLKIKTLDSTCSIVGIIDLDEIEVVERPLYNGDVLLIFSDGVPEAMNSEGVELGETDFYLDSIKEFAQTKNAQGIVDSIANMAIQYVHGEKMRDDVTIVACRIKGEER
ncbi:MAG: PP2C family protein-serine/threonine phosphatase [Treponema sp.]